MFGKPTAPQMSHPHEGGGGYRTRCQNVRSGIGGEAQSRPTPPPTQLPGPSALTQSPRQWPALRGEGGWHVAVVCCSCLPLAAPIGRSPFAARPSDPFPPSAAVPLSPSPPCALPLPPWPILPSLLPFPFPWPFPPSCSPGRGRGRSDTHPPTTTDNPPAPPCVTFTLLHVVSTSRPGVFVMIAYPGTDQAVRGGRHGQKVHSGCPPPPQAGGCPQ